MERDEPSRSPHSPCAIEVGTAGGRLQHLCPGGCARPGILDGESLRVLLLIPSASWSQVANILIFFN